MQRPDPFQRRLRLCDAYAEVFATGAGRAVLNDLLRAGGVLEVSVVAGDPQATAFREGRRALALHVLERLRWREPELIKLAAERTAERLAGVDPAMEE